MIVTLGVFLVAVGAVGCAMAVARRVTHKRKENDYDQWYCA